MELKIISKENAEKGKIKLPEQFNENVRPDLIKRAVLVVEANTRQPYGAFEEAGKRYSAKLSRRRRDYKGAYGKGISRAPRKTMSRRGTQMSWVGAFAPGTVGGRFAHPPKGIKIWKKKINVKERRKAIRSALAATIVPELVKQRGHLIPEKYPFALDSDFESIEKTGDVEKALILIGLSEELIRCGKKKIRAGKGKVRGRRYKKRKGPLIVVSDECKLIKSAKNVPGIDVVKVREINAKLLAPGCHIGRLTLFTNKAVEKLGKEGLFL